MGLLFTGAGVALITPFNEDFSVDYIALGKVVENQITAGMDYLVALGTTAETPTLSEDEKNRVSRFIIEKAAGRVPVMVGVGGNSTHSVIQSIKNLDMSGVAGLLVVTPYYNRPTQEGLYQHYKAISAESTLLLILYNVPSRTGVNMEAETVVKLARDYKNIIGIKEASGNLAQISTIKKYAPKDFLLISGDDALALPTISVGGIGLISVIANAYPKQVSRLVNSALEGNFELSKKLHLELTDMMKLIFKEMSPCGVKALMHHQGVIKNILRLPMVPVSAKNYSEIAEAAKMIV
jgi:4-hydroxy-tetrahydrodipicolinate synthase